MAQFGSAPEFQPEARGPPGQDDHLPLQHGDHQETPGGQAHGPGQGPGTAARIVSSRQESERQNVDWKTWIQKANLELAERARQAAAAAGHRKGNRKGK